LSGPPVWGSASILTSNTGAESKTHRAVARIFLECLSGRSSQMGAYLIGMQKIASHASPQIDWLSKDFLSSSRMTGGG
jgi:hypothetical protein